MYLKNVHIENSGPLRQLTLDLPFTVDNKPKPVVLVGGNGSGKTNLLSIIADALFEAAAKHYHNVVPNAGLRRPWFRVIGASTISVGTQGSFTLLRFEDNGTAHLFREKSGVVAPNDVRSRVSEHFHPAVSWETEGSAKDFWIADNVSGAVFASGVYAYFPSNRSEMPAWLNRESLPEEGFDVALKLEKSLDRQIYVERGLQALKQWLLALLIDGRADVSVVPDRGADSFKLNVPNAGQALLNKQTWGLVNLIIRAILADNGAHLVWLGRHNPRKLAVQARGQLVTPTLDALSAGQATTLSMFGTLIRYADIAGNTAVVSLPDVVGICLIDEIDAHMHIDLQHRALPALVKLFPKVQFIMSSHSPLFVLGMEDTFGAEGFAAIDLPSGAPINAEAYVEFEHALEVVRETKAFSQAVADAAGQSGKMLVLVEGETDPIYYRTAAELTGQPDLMDRVEIDWVGAKDPKGGQGYNTGATAQRATYNVLRANPNIMARTVLLIHDNDIGAPARDDGRLFVRRVPGGQVNKRVKAGIESLLPDDVFIPEMLDEHTKLHENGTEHTTRLVNKMRLCRYVCEDRRNAADFQGFVPLLAMIAEVLAAQAEENCAS